jgi:hypothetical protein
MGELREKFNALLQTASAELYSDYPGAMSSPDLLPTANVIDSGDLQLFFAGVDPQLIRVTRGGKFNTCPLY